MGMKSAEDCHKCKAKGESAFTEPVPAIRGFEFGPPVWCFAKMIQLRWHDRCRVI